MSAYRETDWPLLVLCPSSARYHWEVEFRCWLGSESKAAVEAKKEVKKAKKKAKEEEAKVAKEGSSRMEGANAATTNPSAAATYPTAPPPTTSAMYMNNDGFSSSSGSEEEILEADGMEPLSMRGGGGGIEEGATAPAEPKLLRNSQINVLTSGKDAILKEGKTRVVICSIGLIVNLVNSNRIYPGMFNAIICDESHALKSKSTKRTKAVVPILQAAKRCLLLSGTPALAKPLELWPQLSALGASRRRNGEEDGSSSELWCNESEFIEKYCGKGKGGEDKANKTRYVCVVHEVFVI